MYEVKPRFRIRGLFKYLVLHLLKDEPLHGYEIIQRISNLLGEEYEPSPGIVYPTLQLLEDMDCVVSERIDRKTVYHITEKGRKVLEEHRDEINLLLQRIGAFREFHAAIGSEFFPLVKELLASYSSLSEEEKERIRIAFRNFVRELKAILDKRVI